jgi:hypothetical protein
VALRQCYGTGSGGPHIASNSGRHIVLLVMEPVRGMKINITRDNLRLFFF